jgi:transglutaminase-like putative cysteine protease
MLIRVGFDVAFNVPVSTAMVLMLRLHPSRDASVREPERLRVDPPVPIDEFLDGFGNRCCRIVAPQGALRIHNEALVYDDGMLDPLYPEARQHAVGELPTETLPFLLGSRYCEVDRLTDTAWALFGATPPGWSRVQAVVDWCHANVAFGYAYARPTKTAYDVFCERQGVCRDFTHLAITLCRCLSIPARYVTGYLGDVGVPRVPAPMDFSAWFEVFLENRWWTFDARHNRRRIGRVLMARGRDAVDVALTTSFGPTTLECFVVVTEEVAGGGY